jgi:hypothetical protein
MNRVQKCSKELYDAMVTSELIKPTSSCTGPSDCLLPFHSWLRNQDQWVIAVAQSDIVYQSMKLSYEANIPK